MHGGLPLSIVLWLPLAVGLLAAFLPARVGPRVVLLGAVTTLGFLVAIALDYDVGAGGLQHVTDQMWIAQLGIHYKLGVDGLNLFLLLLTGLIFAAGIAWANRTEWERPKLFYFHFALAESAVLGAFMAQDLALFVIFFDLMLVPFYFLTGTWGQGERRVQATTKLVIYTLVGSLLMLAAAIATGVLSADAGHLSFAFSDLAAHRLPKGSQDWIFWFFAAAFLVKMPAFPLHGWMPDGYRAMPLPALAVFSAVLSKVAAYGFLRVVLPLFPDASAHFQVWMLIISLLSILYGSINAFTQTNVRLILGFSSVAQLGFITLGIFALRNEGAQGAVMQMVNHGLVVAPMFFLMAVLSARAGGSEDLRDMGGIAFRAPILATLFLIAALATLAMPGSANFVGEFLILLGVFKAKLAIALIASTGVALASVYALRAFIRATHNRPGPKVDSFDIGFGDAVIIAPLIVLILAFGVYPQVALHPAEKSVVASVAAAKAKSESGGTAVADNSLRLPPGVQSAGTAAPAQTGVTQVPSPQGASGSPAQAQTAQPQVQVVPQQQAQP
jgi:NADH-quinone oxidoreductase subunit M